MRALQIDEISNCDKTQQKIDKHFDEKTQQKSFKIHELFQEKVISSKGSTSPVIYSPCSHTVSDQTLESPSLRGIDSNDGSRLQNFERSLEEKYACYNDDDSLTTEHDQKSSSL